MTSSTRINNMLLEAGNVAIRMPCLETMEIGNELVLEPGLFEYQVEASYTTLTWSGGPSVELEPSVQEYWGKVAQKECELHALCLHGDKALGIRTSVVRLDAQVI